MAQLQSTNVVGTLCVNGVAVGGGKDFKFCCFTTSGNWTPTSDLVDGGGNVEAIIVAGGGGSGGASVCANSGCAKLFGGGGGGGEVLHQYKNIDSTDACCHVIGAGGSAGSADACTTRQNAKAGGKGGNSTFLGFTAFGGGGGASIGCCGPVGSSAIDNSNQEGGPLAGHYSGEFFGNTICLNDLPYGGSSTIGFQRTPIHNDAGSTIFGGMLRCQISSSQDTTTPYTTSGSIIEGSRGEGYGINQYGIGGGGCCMMGTMPTHDKAYGAGGQITAAGRISAPQGCRCNCTSGSAGQGGIIVLKWAE